MKGEVRRAEYKELVRHVEREAACFAGYRERQVEASNAQHTKNTEVGNRLKGMDEWIEAHQLEMARMNTDVKTKGRLIALLGADVKARAPKYDFDLLKHRFEVFSEIETIEKLNEHFLPKIKVFMGHLARFEESNIETRDCVRDLDRSLTLKCSKSALLESIHDVRESCLSNEDAKLLDAKIDSTKSLIWDREKNLE